MLVIIVSDRCIISLLVRLVYRMWGALAFQDDYLNGTLQFNLFTISWRKRHGRWKITCIPSITSDDMFSQQIRGFIFFRKIHAIQSRFFDSSVFTSHFFENFTEKAKCNGLIYRCQLYYFSEGTTLLENI